MELQLRDNFSQEDFEFLKNLTNDVRVYQHIRDGKCWSDHKINRFLENCMKEEKLPVEGRESFNYMIEKNNDRIGFIGVSKRKRKFSMTIFIDPSCHGMGYFSKSLNILKGKLRISKPRLSHIFAQVHVENQKMNSILTSKFEYVRRYNIGDIPVDEYLIYL